MFGRATDVSNDDTGTPQVAPTTAPPADSGSGDSPAPVLAADGTVVNPGIGSLDPVPAQAMPTTGLSDNADPNAAVPTEEPTLSQLEEQVAQMPPTDPAPQAASEPGSTPDPMSDTAPDPTPDPVPDPAPDMAAPDPSSSPDPLSMTKPDPGKDPVNIPEDLLEIKQQALHHLAPLVNKLDLSPEEKFRTVMMLVQSTDDQNLVKLAYEAAEAIPDEAAKAQALLDVVNEINYFTQPNTSQK